MNILRKLLAVSAAVVVAGASGTVVAHADSTPTVYNTPGGQMSGGRLWDTTCEMYSSNVVRCRANIWATQVQYRGGRYVSVTGWTFNNLSYLPSPRASWAGNNLARNNDRWISGGRTWRTECDTATTGRGGCRSYVWTKQARRVGGGYVAEHRWVFNNLVLFSSASVPAVTEVPPWIIDEARLDVRGLGRNGPLRVGAPMKDLETLGYATWDSEPCESWDPSTSLKNRGIDTYAGGFVNSRLFMVLVDEPGVLTEDDAHVGMTLGEIKALYGARITLETKDGYQPVYTAVVQRDGYELVFLNGFELDRPLIDSDVIEMILARRISDDLLWDGC